MVWENANSCLLPVRVTSPRGYRGPGLSGVEGGCGVLGCDGVYGAAATTVVVGPVK